METAPRKSIMRSLGECIGYVVRGLRTDPSRTVVRRSVEEETRGGVILRRTTIEEVELTRERREP